MIRIVWLLVVLYVALGTGLFYSLAIGSTTKFLALAGAFAFLAILQRSLLSDSVRRRRRFGNAPRNS
ncbi:hypothetical protein [Halosolutus gelatinilyticus]|uniref:hypothetical protein n=1 Tax=Halosolutus gelatinilyticus TaxID=2931975 RepID=UPI001FF3B759|nr:hypothetical protein [Halosolutus gelatinilyticus]